MAKRFLSNIRINDAYTFPASDGTNNQVIKTDGSGNLSFGQLATDSASVMYKDTFTGDGSTTGFTLANALNDEVQSNIYIDGVYQSKSTYSVSGTTVTFSTAPLSGHEIEVISTTGINSGPTAIYTDTFTANGSATAFTLGQTVHSENQTIVFLNGVYQFKGTYALSGTTLTLDTAPSNGVSIEVMSIGSAYSGGDILYDHDFTSAGLMTSNGSGVYSITANNSANWNTAYGWGDHGLSAQDKTDIGNLSGTNTGDQDLSSYATQSYVGTQISNLVDSSPATLNTLNELAAALGDDPNFATTVTNSIAAKLPLAGGTLTGGLTGTTAGFSGSITASGNSNSFGNTTIGALAASTGTFSASVTAAGNSNSFGTSTFTGVVTIPGAISAGTNGGLRIHSSGTKFFNVTAANAARNNIMDIGAPDAKFKDLYLGGSITAGVVNATRFVLPSTASAANHYIFTDNTNTGTGSMLIQSGGGSAGYGGGMVLYSHSHASKPGWVTAGISGGSGGKFTVNTFGNATGTDIFTIDTGGTAYLSGKMGIGTTSPNADLEVKTLTGGSGVNTLRLNTSFANGNTVDINPFITGVNNGGMEIKLAGSQKLVILPSGNVGIGVTGPVNKLGIEVAANSNTKAINIYSKNTSPNSYTSIGSQYSISNTYVESEIRFGNETQNGGGSYLGFVAGGTNSGNTEKMRITSGGNVGIGTTLPVKKLQVSDSATGLMTNLLLTNTHDTDGDTTGISFSMTDNDLYNKAGIVFERTGNSGVGSLRFCNDNTANDSNFTLSDARVSILNTGEIVLGSNNSTAISTDNIHSLGDVNRPGLTSAMHARFVMQERTGNWISFVDGTPTHYGTISRSGSGVNYGSNSDYRLKENVLDLTNCIDKVKLLSPKTFNFIARPDTTVIGFLAHEVQEIVSEAVTGEKDGTITTGNVINDSDGTILEQNVNEPEELEEGTSYIAIKTEPKYQQIDQSKLVPLLVGAIQELKAEIETLKTQINGSD